MGMLKTIIGAMLGVIAGVILLALLLGFTVWYAARSHQESATVVNLLPPSVFEPIGPNTNPGKKPESSRAFATGEGEWDIPAFVPDVPLTMQLPQESTPLVSRPLSIPRKPASSEPGTFTLSSDWKVDSDQAVADLSQQIQARIAERLGRAGVSARWKPPIELLNKILPTPVLIESEDRDYARLYRASQSMTLSPELERKLVSVYRRQKAGLWLGAALFMILAVLAIVSLRIRAVEATGGYASMRLFAALGLVVLVASLIRTIRAPESISVTGLGVGLVAASLGLCFLAVCSTLTRWLLGVVKFGSTSKG